MAQDDPYETCGWNFVVDWLIRLSTQAVQRANYTRCVSPRSERMGKLRLGAPPGAVARSYQAGFDANLQVADRGFYALLHRLTGQVITAEDKVDRGARKKLLCPQTSIDDACVRAGGKHRYPPAGHAAGNKTLVHDQRIRHAVSAAEGVVAGEPGLVLRDTVDRTATEKEASADGMRLVEVTSSPPACAMSSNVGSGGSMTITPFGNIKPR